MNLDGMASVYAAGLLSCATVLYGGVSFLIRGWLS